VDRAPPKLQTGDKSFCAVGTVISDLPSSETAREVVDWEYRTRPLYRPPHRPFQRRHDRRALCRRHDNLYGAPSAPPLCGRIGTFAIRLSWVEGSRRKATDVRDANRFCAGPCARVHQVGKASDDLLAFLWRERLVERTFRLEVEPLNAIIAELDHEARVLQQDPKGPNAASEMLRFFYAHVRGEQS